MSRRRALLKELPPQFPEADRLAALEREAREVDERIRAKAAPPPAAARVADSLNGSLYAANRRVTPAQDAAVTMREATEDDRKRLKIPPAWTNVLVSNDPSSKLLAKGKDTKGRWQSIYSSEHSMAALAAKFERGKRIDSLMPSMVARIEEGITNGDEEASVLRLIYLTGFRTGGEKDTGAKVKAYGATTLLADHVEIDGDIVRACYELLPNKEFNIKVAKANQWMPARDVLSRS